MALSLAASLIPAAAQTAGGLFQTLFSGRKKAQREIEGMLKNQPMYRPSKDIADYYQESLNRYNENPYQSAQYQTAKRNAQRLTSTGLSALQDRRSALAGVNRLVGVENDALQNAAVQAEQQRNVRFNQLGSATGMKAGEDRRAFDINVQTPYQRRLQMAQMKAGAAASRYDAGLSNIFGGIGSAASILGNAPKNEITTSDAAVNPIGSTPYGGATIQTTERLTPRSNLFQTLPTLRPFSLQSMSGSNWNRFNQAFMPKNKLSF